MSTKKTKKTLTDNKNLKLESSSVVLVQQPIDYHKKIRKRIDFLEKKIKDLKVARKKNFMMFNLIELLIMTLSVIVASFESTRILSLTITLLTIINFAFQPKAQWVIQDQTAEDLGDLIDHCENGVCEFKGKSLEESFHLLYEESDKILKNNRQSQRAIYNQQSTSQNGQKTRTTSGQEETGETGGTGVPTKN
ncbi:MAG: hypothetical protein PUC50_13145 [Bacteroidales bacterium]|nr:hypothetical protein [Bacteroidales bacterium]